jgi:CheY-like chemotaxis protein
MVYGIVQQSGGHITVESAPGQGSSFRIFLPRADEERATPVPGADVAAVLSGSETVLVVEDEPSIRDLAREFLEGLGYSVLCAAGGEEALSLAARLEGPIHLLLADVAMPGMSGPTLAERLLVFRPRTRVLYMSAYAGAELANRGLAEEAAHFLPKPFTQEVLGRRVRRALDRPA